MKILNNKFFYIGLLLAFLLLVVLSLFLLMGSQKQSNTSSSNGLLIFQNNNKPPIIDQNSFKKHLLSEFNTLRKEKNLSELKFNEKASLMADTVAKKFADKNIGFTRVIDMKYDEKDVLPLEKRLRGFDVQNWKEAIEFYEATSVVKKVSAIDNKPKEYKSEKELLTELSAKLLNNANFRQSLLNKEIDMIGIGFLSDEENYNYFLVIVLMKSTDCGYPNKKCCVEQGYLPYCYYDYKCQEDICV
ncbi:MAG: hypothetical protein N3E37_03860 [Candidatus Micrarchaeota archaeon]|nr:hypothetical protein [Candidatus Micrarchaeota archaeon]